VRVIDYHASRVLRFRAALASFFRRWGLYVAIGVIVFSAGTNAPLVIAVGLASSLMWPMRLAAAHGPVIVPAIVGYAVVGALPVISTRPLWWPRGWAEAERALPITPAEIRRSDRIFALLLMAPWQGVLAIGALGVSFDRGSSQGDPDRWVALAAWAISIVASLWLAASWMRFVRDAANPSSGSAIGLGRRTAKTASRSRGGPFGSGPIRKLDVRVALVLLPLWRGHAKRTAAALALGLVATLASATCAGWSALSIEWACALTAVAASCATSLLRVATARELQPLWLTTRQLPLAVRTCEAARLVVMLTPMFVGMPACLAATAHRSAHASADASVLLRPQVVMLYATTLVAGCVIEAITPRATQPQDHAARWLLMLIAAVAFASEISAS
jgi:hypothetical protein